MDYAISYAANLGIESPCRESIAGAGIGGGDPAGNGPRLRRAGQRREKVSPYFYPKDRGPHRKCFEETKPLSEQVIDPASPL